MSAFFPNRATTLATLSAALVLAAPLAGTATAAPNKGGGTTEVKCEGKGGGKPGEKVTQTTATKYRGKIVFTTTTTFICGDDGKWHEVLF